MWPNGEIMGRGQPPEGQPIIPKSELDPLFSSGTREDRQWSLLAGTLTTRAGLGYEMDQLQIAKTKWRMAKNGNGCGHPRPERSRISVAVVQR